MPQLNPEFFVSQLFWLTITFTFLFIFLWRISLPRIGNVLEKRAKKISEDIKEAKKYQVEAEDIQSKIDFQLRNAKSENADLIKTSVFNFQDKSSKELEYLNQSLNAKLNDASTTIENNKNKSLKEINDQIYDITKLTFSKISDIKINNDEIKEVIQNIQQKVIH